MLRACAIALVSTGLMAAPAMAQGGDFGSQGYQGGYNQGQTQGYGGNQDQYPGQELSNDTVRAIQRRLGQLGFYRGNADGDWGPETSNALAQFQRQRGINAEQQGSLDPETLAALGLTGGMQTGQGYRSGNPASGGYQGSQFGGNPNQGTASGFRGGQNGPYGYQGFPQGAPRFQEGPGPWGYPGSGRI